VQNDRYKCWEAVGPVGEVWTRLGPEIKKFVDDSCKPVPGFTFGIYMIGDTEETAKPKILICSTDFRGRKGVRKAILESGILESYPPIGLGDMARAPGLMALEEIESTFPLDSALGDETYVLAASSDKAFGRRLFIPGRDGGSLRPATGGPILYINGNIYQLTVGHAFLGFDGLNTPRTQSSSSDECDFDGQSDSEDYDTSADLQMTDKSKRRSNNPAFHNGYGPDGDKSGFKSHDDPSSLDIESSSSTLANQSSRDSGVGLSPESASAGNDQSQIKEPATSQSLHRVSKLALLSETGAKQSLDYGLVELERKYRLGRNEIPYGPNSSKRFLQVRQAAKIGSGYVNVVTMTASSKFLSGKLCPTASYMWLSNQRTLQELYPVHLDGTLSDGDCGAGVVDQATGHLYGHIVAGTAGTGFAYIVLAIQVFEDIVDRCEGDVTLEPASPAHLSTKRRPIEPLRVVEFASKKYFSELKESTGSNGDETTLNKPAPIAPIPRSLMSKIDLMTAEGQFQQHKSPRRLKFRDPTKGFRSKIPILQPKALAAKPEGKGKGKEVGESAVWKGIAPEMRDLQEETGMTSFHTFEQRFFALPTDLQVQIIASLCVPDILRLRIASRNWHNLISLNEAPIARAFLEYNPGPRFALSLYPPPSPTEINLHYIYGLWHRLFVASKLSSVMAEWITEDHFLQREEEDRLKFLPRLGRMHRRLAPLLFIIFHFLEMYRDLHLKHPLGHSQSLLHEADKINPVEAQIMSMYDNEMFLQAHQVFPLVVSCLCRMLRPPSYLGRLERSFRGYHSQPPPDRVLVAILCIGGLREVERFSQIGGYEARRMAVDEWYSAVSREPIISGPQSHRLAASFNRMLSRLTPFSTSETSKGKTSSMPESVSAFSNSRDRHGGGTRSNCSDGPLFNKSLAAGPPMAPLPAEHIRLLLPDLPSLKHLWIQTAEALLLKRRVVERRQDIKKNAELLLDLVREGITNADRLFYERAEHSVIQEDAMLVRDSVEEFVFVDGGFSRLGGWYDRAL
jgi:hypothetical protein